ncbi:MAG: hypothetical protein ACYSU0_10990 [Planctomycetota bacterium]
MGADVRHLLVVASTIQMHWAALMLVRQLGKGFQLDTVGLIQIGPVLAMLAAALAGFRLYLRKRGHVFVHAVNVVLLLLFGAVALFLAAKGIGALAVTIVGIGALVSLLAMLGATAVAEEPI